MKILKIFGIVVGIHIFALILIFANPGCSSTTKPPPSPADTVASAEPAPKITLPPAAAAPASDPAPMLTPPPATFNPDAPATYAGSSGSSNGVRFTPTRPNTPAASAVQAQPVENVTPVATHVVKAGDSLWTLQKKYHVALKDIAAANNLKTSAPLHEGQKLIIPSKPTSSAPAAVSSAMPASASLSATSSTKTGSSAGARPVSEGSSAAPGGSDEFKYTVKPGESLGSIARKFDVKASAIGARNNIRDPKNLRAGTELVIPDWHATGGKATKAGGSDTAKSATPAPAEPKPPVNVIDTEEKPPGSNVPVIKIDDNPLSPAPKQP